jgi:hypothetical protein
MVDPQEEGVRAPEYVVALLKQLGEEIEKVLWNIHQEWKGSPAQNTGTVFETDVFSFRAYSWLDCDCGRDEREIEYDESHPHSPACYQSILRLRLNGVALKFGLGNSVDPARYSVMHEQSMALRDAEKAAAQKLCREMGLTFPDGYLAHCTCGRDAVYVEWLKENGHEPLCPVVRPNFQCGDFEVRWYKRCGRGTFMNRPITPAEMAGIYERCYESALAQDKEAV